MDLAMIFLDMLPKAQATERKILINWTILE